MYHCYFCGAEFEEPTVITRCENLDGENGWWTHTDAFCPVCGEDQFEKIKEEDDAEL